MTIYLTVVRDPDSSNEFYTDSDDLVYLDIDLGNSFTGRPSDEDQAQEWAENMVRAMAILPTSSRAYGAALDVVLTAIEHFPAVAEFVTTHDATRPSYAYDSTTPPRRPQ